MSYADKLKDPRWQKKRLEIFERDKWTCRACGEKEETLHVHHIFYLPHTEPWEIPNGFLITFCENCHLGYCEDGPCNKCEYYDLDPENLSRCEGPINHKEELLNEIAQLLDLLWSDSVIQDYSDYSVILFKLRSSIKRDRKRNG